MSFVRVCALALSLSALAAPVSAALVEIDLPGGNLNEATRDTATGLEWLDVPATRNMRYSEAVGFANTFYGGGWRHANVFEVCALFSSHGMDAACDTSVLFTFGDPPEDRDVIGGIIDSDAPHTELDVLLTLLGGNGRGGQGLEQEGFFEIFDPTLVGVTFLRKIPDFETRTSLRVSAFTGPEGTHGSYLVRAVPEPTLLSLVGIALLLAVLTRRLI